jgi:two-component system, chemotaxis family, CheB/CheR fusion protein
MTTNRNDNILKIRDANATGTTELLNAVVAIGASAGGLKALEELFSGLRPDTGMCFVVLTHQLPRRETILDRILQSYTHMVVDVIRQPTPLMPNHVFVAADGTVDIENGILLPKQERSLLPISHFLNNLARDQKEKAMAVLLSGTGTDGTEGVRAVANAGGKTFVQAPHSAEYSGMPFAAIQSGAAQHVLTLELQPSWRLT